MQHPIWNNSKAKLQILQIGLSLLLLFVNNCTCKLSPKDGNSHNSEPVTSSSNDQEEPPVNEEKPPVKPGLGGGIAQIGNSCYMNATLQIFKALYPNAFKNKSDAISQAGQKLMDALDGAAGADSATAGSFFTALTDKVHGPWKPTGDKSQEDAYDLLRTLFAYLEFPGAKIRSVLTKPSISGPKERFSENTSNILEVSLPDSEETMQDYFDANFGKKYPLTDYKWEGDLQTTPGVQVRQVLSELNSLYGGILVVHLLRYKLIKNDTGNLQEVKLENLAKNPFHLVIKKEQLLKKEEGIVYELVGFILHSGGTGGGHYVAYAKKGAQWGLYDDARVSIPSEQDLNSAAEKAYVYFYRRVNQEAA